ncbi:SDR family NAD(P)-dependent oxidoreductase [Nonomuraea sp. bgisy101]|uniref:SDR family NAD(P)-dependent oxidoreductase n=1 Tax=Nonomuraea sp. bgisy101 TaxID=3413784 RepID=UPI003D73480C
MATSLSGRVAVITGAAGRVAETLAELGATLVVAGPAPGVRQAADLALTLDLADPMALNVLATAVEERHGRIDLLVAAATGTTMAPFESVTAGAERALVEENFTGVTTVIRRLLPLMGGGSSIAVLVPEEARHALDAAMKAAVESLCEALAVELAPRGVGVGAFTEAAAYQLWCSGMPSV